ncbi:uncharacterized protein VICG_02076 [Vittaforma corneae ATCC 50505]|uniref:U2A'/phosphoprotein 32 family A C-terminal domain-containing protein n=1 Tax=Vittaforma corneae (strain ATCC 50505) TaxID=993615 RepID=L2GJ54_VITCO|nr:uncharacterized protein VICG_02076 [Vittaforma corneae ATCC 50505]ELA40896.1 hypothetical protein VICG_02076 [Vittaforma corneae ATCC 50505]
MLALFDVGLTEIPYLSNLTDLKSLYLGSNGIVRSSFRSFFNAETGRYRTMPKLKYLGLNGNNISKVDASIKDVFPNQLMVISLDELGLCSIHGNMKDKLDKVGIQLVEPDEKSDSDVKN